jgi:Ca2+-transporting ATPase
MDTFAAGALASLPPSWSVMRDRPRRSGENGDFIISKSMARTIFGTGIFFTILLTSVLIVLQSNGHMSEQALSWFFTFFVMLQVWNMFNAKAFMTRRSAFAGLWQSKSFLWVIALIIVGQYLIVTFGGKMFNVVPLTLNEWLTISVMTMPVLVFGEIARLIQSRKN